MNKQRGIATGWLYLIGLIVLVGALTGLVMAWKSYTSGLVKQGYDAGVAKTKAEYAERDNKALQDTIKERDALIGVVRELEKTHAEETAALGVKLRKEKTDEIRKRETIIAGLHDGSIILRDPGREDSGCPGSAVSSTGATVVATGSGTHAAGGAELSGPLTEFLVAEASRANTLVRKTTALQAQVIADRKACSAPIAISQ